MTVLLVGGGGREHAIAWRLTRDDPSLAIVAAPGNPGIAELAECVPVQPSDIDGLVRVAREKRVDYTVVGPEAPLAAGIVDRFRDEGQAIFGPTRAAAEIETSKSFAKGLMQEAGIPTARAIICTEATKAKGAARAFGLPIVIKASGLAAGKGVIVCESFAEADRAIDSMLVSHVFGVAGQEVLVEEFMTGEELSILAITDGKKVLPLVPAQDHKRLLDGDKGPNTGGMGAYTPVSVATASLLDDVVARIYEPTLAALASRARPFTGLLYAGLMLTPQGPKVVEFNCRFGDPETQAILPRLRSDPLTALEACLVPGGLTDVEMDWMDGWGVTVVLASAGYPASSSKGDVIAGLDALTDTEHVEVTHAGTARQLGKVVTAGGRVLNVTGLGDSVDEARARAYEAVEQIDFEGAQYRPDIAAQVAERVG
jgi:phosphoribosylamine---glycine ligase